MHNNYMIKGRGSMNEQDVERIKEIIQEKKQSYILYGGDVEFVDIKEEKVRVKAEGYCHR